MGPAKKRLHRPCECERVQPACLAARAGGQQNQPVRPRLNRALGVADALATSANTIAPASWSGARTGPGVPTLVMTSSGACFSTIRRSSVSLGFERCTIRFGKMGRRRCPFRWRAAAIARPYRKATYSKLFDVAAVGGRKRTNHPMAAGGDHKIDAETKNIGAAISGSLKHPEKA